MWKLTENHCAKIPLNKAEEVVVTFTEYNKDLIADQRLYEILKKSYKKIYYWTQQPNDYKYIKSIGDNNVTYIDSSLKGLDQILKEKQVDYVGTRLHAGIRALQH